MPTKSKAKETSATRAELPAPLFSIMDAAELDGQNVIVIASGVQYMPGPGHTWAYQVTPEGSLPNLDNCGWIPETRLQPRG